MDVNGNGFLNQKLATLMLTSCYHNSKENKQSHDVPGQARGRMKRIEIKHFLLQGRIDE